MAEAASGKRPVALVVGATRGIGAALATGFARDGYDLVLTGRDAAALGEVAGTCRDAGAYVTSHALDVADTEAVADVVDTAWQESGRIDVALVSAGAIEGEAPPWELPLEESWQVLEVNLRGPLAVAHALVPRMLGAGGGRIVHVNSGSGVRNSPVYAAYGASKAGLSRLTGSLHEAGWDRGLRAFDLAPGVVRTDMTASMPIHHDRTEWTAPQQVVDLALGLASGELDAWSGRMVRAGADTVEQLQRHGGRLDARARTVGLLPYGDDDPVS
ncbi:SDR family NAD(P)-dependent oxidoreductase [Kytococcus sp. Marseille-QA3725]